MFRLGGKHQQKVLASRSFPLYNNKTLAMSKCG